MKARKKPVEVEVVKLENTKESILEARNFLINGTTIGTLDSITIEHVTRNDGIIIDTLEGNMLANFDDYIIKGVNGEFYPCKPDIFHKTYDIVEEVEE